MWSKILNRTEFVDLIGNLEQRNPLKINTKHSAPSISPERQSLWALWSNNPTETTEYPNLIVVSDAEVIDFLAWTATFLIGFRPFTSFFRVLSWSAFQKLENQQIEPEFSSLLFRAAYRQGEPDLTNLEEVFVGVTLGETLTNTQSRASFESLSTQAFASTFSFAMARGIALQLPNDLLDNMADKWGRARELTGQPVRKLTLQHLNLVWSVIRSLKNDTDIFGSQQNYTVIRACHELQQQKQITYSTWNDLTGGKIDLQDITKEMLERKEQRVRLFEKIVSDIPYHNEVLVQSSFICGFLASLVSESTLDHADLVFPVLDRFPTALLWYGICVGLAPGSRLQSYKGGLGRRLLKDILRSEHLFARPYADLSIEELEVFSNSESQQTKIPQRSSATLSVEIAPMITVSLKWPSKRTDETSQQLIPEDEFGAIVPVLKELGSALDKAVAIHRGVIGHLQQREYPLLSQEPRTKKRRR